VSALTSVDKFPTPSIDYGVLAPVLIVLGVAVVSVLVEAVVARAHRRNVQLVLVFGALAAAFVAVVRNSGTRTLAAQDSVAIDGPALFMQGTILLLAFVGALLMAERLVDPVGDGFAAQASSIPGSSDEVEFTRHGWFQTEVWPLFLFSVGGMLLFPISNDLLMMFVALEVLSLPLYLMTGLARRRRMLSQEAALKYFLLGAFSSAFFIYGSALLYGFAGTVEFGGIADALTSKASQTPLLLGGTALVAVGLLFKIGAAPFHQWTPDVYQGAPTSVTAFMATCTKVAAFGALLRVFFVPLGGLQWDWRPMMYVIAAFTMLVGTVIALTQTDIKRMLAYSSIAHAGFLLIAVVATNSFAISSALFYLFAYGFMTLGAFGVVTLVRDSAGEATHLSQWAGLGKKSPLIAGIFAFFLLALAGIPLTSGFIAKFAVFEAGILGGAGPLVVIAVVLSAVAAFFYVRVIVLMFFNDPAPDGPSVVLPSAFTSLALAIGVGVTLVAGILPQQLLDLANQAGVFLR